ncbi:MAG: beta-galactosidase trimerization domain-containing protein, partial [Victivallaceae bacterium]|nr:beta-galactosidase trimerization domain-containing protein [Victivallaceae bacterium]
DPRHIKIWTDIIEELGKNYKSRHKSLVGIFPHEVNCAECPDTHRDDLEEFSKFCLKNFGEKYTGSKIPTGKDGAKWDKRFCLYRNDVVTNFTKAMRDAAAKYDMQTQFCFYPPETGSDSVAWGYDALELEKICDRMWVVSYSNYYDLKKPFIETSFSYKGANIPYNETVAFHGSPISFFEYRTMLFPMVLRRAYQKSPGFTKVYGDYLNGYAKKSEKVLQLFTGLDNVKKWNNLQMEWIGAERQSKIGLFISSVPFVLRYPVDAGRKYKEVYKQLRENLKKYYPVDTQLIGAEFTLKPENLMKYDLIIIPEEMGIGMDEAFFRNLKEYLSRGGKVLAISSAVTTGSRDLEKQHDHMEELFGIKIKKGQPLAGYVRLESEKLAVPAGKTWGTLRDVELISADEVIIREKNTKKPVMTRKGNAYYLVCSYNDDKNKIFTDFIDKITPQSACLKGNDNFRFSSITRQDNTLCVALPGEKPATAVLSLDTGKLGLTGKRFEVKNIITGQVLYEAGAEELKKGVKISTNYANEPYVLAVGTSRDLTRFKGLYPNNKVFADMGKINVIENPEVAIAVSDRPGIKVGVYQNAHGAEEIYNRLSKMPEFNCFYLPRLDGACMRHADVIIIPHARSSVFFDNAVKVIKSMVKTGKGLILTHDSAAKATAGMFPDIIAGNNGKIKNIENNGLMIQNPVSPTATVKRGDEYVPGWAFDHYAFKPGKDARVIARDKKGYDVVLSGKYGKGRVVVFGTLPGCFCPWNDCKKYLQDDLKGKELQLLTDSVKWLAGNKNGK